MIEPFYIDARASVRGGAYGKWIFFDPGSLGWHTGEYYCENEWQ